MMAPQMLTEEEHPESDYHDITGYGPDKILSRSMICTYIKSPYLFYLEYVHDWGEAGKPKWVGFNGSKAARFGSYFEDLWNGFEGPWTFAETGSNDFDKPTITFSEQTMSLLMMENMKRNEMVRPYWDMHEAGTLESNVTFVWQDELTGLMLHCRYDLLSLNPLIRADIKTAGSVRPDKLKYKIKEFGYDVQDVMYSEALGIYLNSIGQNYEDTPMDVLFHCKRDKSSNTETE